MAINWKLRFKNKVVLTAIMAWLLKFLYMILQAFNITFPFEQNELFEIFNNLIEVTVLIGIVTDPTTAGMADSANAMQRSDLE